jgi:hypothetical protein
MNKYFCNKCTRQALFRQQSGRYYLSPRHCEDQGNSPCLRQTALLFYSKILPTVDLEPARLELHDRECERMAHYRSTS